MPPRVLVVAGALCVLLAGSVVIGRHEGRTANAKQIAEIRLIKSLTGSPLDNARL